MYQNFTKKGPKINWKQLTKLHFKQCRFLKRNQSTTFQTYFSLCSSPIYMKTVRCTHGLNRERHPFPQIDGPYTLVFHCGTCSLVILNVPQNQNWAASWQNQQNGMCAQPRLRSAWASAQSDHLGIRRSDQSLRWARMPFCWFCYDAAQCVAKDPSFLQTDSEDSDQTGQ